ncbi:hypothetical protein M747DRAFT_57304 [Aspergillus niger ATCC 13496]|uniref:Uncharacterized protein n=1 Tax=Aspergillus niger ATCC 13496 TaxID=1353008 RepID=A0A370CC93_ASPNG|nr:hypothetical protein M747DRAFT_57304 [Aspergillus niger ATCC 13496]
MVLLTALMPPFRDSRLMPAAIAGMSLIMIHHTSGRKWQGYAAPNHGLRLGNVVLVDSPKSQFPRRNQAVRGGTLAWMEQGAWPPRLANWPDFCHSPKRKSTTLAACSLEAPCSWYIPEAFNHGRSPVGGGVFALNITCPQAWDFHSQETWRVA